MSEHLNRKTAEDLPDAALADFTLLLDDERFIKMKPTIVQALFADVDHRST